MHLLWSQTSPTAVNGEGRFRVLGALASRGLIFALCLVAGLILPTLHCHPAVVVHIDLFPFADDDHDGRSHHGDDDAKSAGEHQPPSLEIGLPSLAARGLEVSAPTAPEGLWYDAATPDFSPIQSGRRRALTQGDSSPPQPVFVDRGHFPRPPPRT